MDDNQQSLLGTRKIHTETYKNQAYDLIKNAILYNRFRVDAIYSQEATAPNSVSAEHLSVRLFLSFKRKVMSVSHAERE